MRLVDEKRTFRSLLNALSATVWAKLHKDLAINIGISLLASAIGTVIGYYLYINVDKSQKQFHTPDSSDDYQVSLYNHQGRRVSEMNGTFKLIIDPFTIFNNYPNQKSQSYSINKDRFRDGYTSDKPYTAIVLGGSAAFGWHLDDNKKTFISRLSQSSPKYNVMNAAVVAFLSGQELAQMVHYLDDFHPDLYIAFNGWNDVSDPYLSTRSWPAVYTSFGFYHFFSDIENRLAEHDKINDNGPKLQIAVLEPVGERLNEQDYFQKILKKYLKNIQKMHAFALSRNAKFLLVFQPEITSKRVLSEEEKKFLRASNQKPYEYIDKKIPEKYKSLIENSKKVLIDHKISFVDINADPEFYESRATLFYDVIHPNEQGHEVIAKILHRELMERF